MFSSFWQLQYQNLLEYSGGGSFRQWLQIFISSTLYTGSLAISRCQEFVVNNLLSCQQFRLFVHFNGIPLAKNSIRRNLISVLETSFGDKK